MWVAWVSCWGSFFTSQSFQFSDNLNDFINPLKIVNIRTSATVFKLDFLLSETVAKLSFCFIHFSHDYTNITFVIFVMACCWGLMWSSTSLTFRVSDLSWVLPFRAQPIPFTSSFPFFAIWSAKHPHRFYAFKCLWKNIFWLNGNILWKALVIWIDLLINI